MTNVINSLKEKFETLGKEGYILDIDTDSFIARLKRVSKRARFGYKQEWAYRFKSLDALLTFVEKDYNSRIKSIESSATRKTERKENAKKQANSVNVGDIFCYSWGWEQTNVDFYQVVEKPSSATVIVRPINYKTLEECSWASEYVRPVKDSFVGERTEKVRLNGTSFKRSCGYASKVDSPETSKHYHSWYA
jgi:hypothetical protein